MSEWKIKPTKFSALTINPQRLLWERNQPKGNPLMSKISLQIGDPTIHGNFPPHPEWIEALAEAVKRDKFSYDESAGGINARQAVADYRKCDGNISAADVFLTSGSSMAIEFAFMTLAEPGENILIPRPAFNYCTWAAGTGIKLKSYNLDPTKGWDVDLKHMESLIDEQTRAILVNSPGNPCGNVFSKQSILAIIDVAERYKLPIIADEVYEFFVFPGTEFRTFASLSKNVPILTCSGLTKRFLMPGVRMGWLILNDRGDKLKDVRSSFANICGRNFGPNSSVQLALPKILQILPENFFNEVNERIWKNALAVFNILKDAPGLTPVMPTGAFYMMIGIDFAKFPEFPSSEAFMRALANEQSVFTFPGECFNFPDFLRIVITAQKETLIDAANRMKAFCEKHSTQ